jgi:formylglycine-generating enzyme required for sulfatase activity
VPTTSNEIWNAVTIVPDSTGYRLPTEAQWEYACRAGTTTAYNTGTYMSTDTGWYNLNSNDMTHEVGLKLPNAFGLYDMHGNVWEWCWDWYGTYVSGAQLNPMRASSGTARTFRGGSWINTILNVRSASRSRMTPNSRSSEYEAVGFRLSRP